LSDSAVDREIKICCATFYESEAIRMLLGESFHPGGLALTYHLGEVLGLNEADHVLDVACGRGVSAVHLAKSFSCHITGADYSHQNIDVARNHAAEQGVSHLVGFRQGDAEGLPFHDRTFGAVISECSFCTFPNKEIAAEEMARVVCKNGRIGFTDMTVNGALPDEIRSMLSWVACVTGAGTPENYTRILEKAGFTDFVVENQKDWLLEMVRAVRRRLLAIELAVGLGKLDLGDLDVNEGKRLAQNAVELIYDGTLGYTLIAGRRA